MAGVIEISQIKDRLHSSFDKVIPLMNSKGKSPEQKEKNFLSKALACEALKLTYSNELSSEIAYEQNVDGGQDNGIDAIYFNKKKCELCFVQSKYRENGKKGITPSETSEFIRGVDKILQLNFDDANKKIQRRVDELNEIFRENTDIKCKLVLIQTVKDTSEDVRKRLNDYITSQESEDYSYDIIEIDRIYSDVVRGDRNVMLERVSVSSYGEYETSDNKAYYGRVTLDQIYSWWKLFGDKLTDQNLRRSLGDTNINIGIKKTLEIEPANFWFYNNGITIVTDKIELYNGGKTVNEAIKLKCKNANIVNGAQTFSSVGEYGAQLQKPLESLKEANVLVKIIELKNDEEEEISGTFLHNITKFNNSQNNISGRDFITFDKVQQTIRTQLEAENIKYYLMRESDDRNTDRKKTLSVRDVTRALAFSVDSDIAIKIKREIGLAIDNPDSQYYKRIFTNSVTGFFTWNIVQIHRKVDEGISSKMVKLSGKELAILRYGRDLLANLILTDMVKSVPKDKLYSETQLKKINISPSLNKYIEKLNIFLKEPQFAGQTLSKLFNSINSHKQLFLKMKNAQSSNIVADEDVKINYPLWVSDRDKNTFNKFFERMGEDILAKKVLKYIVENIYRKNYEIGYTTNMHFYVQGEGPREARFLFRFAYYTKGYLSFKYHAFGTYNSIWLKEHKEVISAYTENKNKIIVNEESDCDNLESIFKDIVKN
ncbi:hypothetical protein FC19_GL001063 [Liquorilactobacillus aquaticus DSM 21051]|uniref:Abortive phage infection protein C-terminal domain-containing protein n=1 Tax=Liquorilactobacillus aquaticus DSM 21051 TaxID=1423725 RepID=A0A0R2CVW7_9LACO|nr:AIPR family protein [Liquorilactobacillus aquaticus]KRM95999.1 hypothetical protein FC19_GL001063 [Liquorilactobacillus aquaticus DSM 21051]